MKTRQRILKTALTLFNKMGESNISTVDIATEMSISPGNLYYHFRNKDEIILSLVSELEEHLKEILEALALSLVDLLEDDTILTALLELTWRFRTLYRDTHSITSRNKEALKRLSRLMQNKEIVFTHLLQKYNEEEILLIPPTYIECVAQQLLILSCGWFFWLNYDQTQEATEDQLQKACKQIRAVLLPWLNDENWNQTQKI